MAEQQVRTVSVRALTVKYIAGLTIIALLSLTTYLAVQQIIATEQASAAIINVSGRQRMLAQKTALLGLQLADAADPARKAALRGELARTIAYMEANHAGLASGSADLGLPATLSPEVRAILFGRPVMLDAKLREYLAEAKQLVQAPDSELSDANPHLIRIVAMSGELVDALNMVVNQYQKESEARTASLLTVQTTVLAIMIVVLVLEAMFLFQPAVMTIRREADELAAANAELQRLSNVDGLTAIANRRLFDGFLAREWLRAVRRQEPLTLVMIDVDHFKNFNDTYGHQAGDDCLRRVAAALQANIKRTTDLIARYGGEEFAAVLPDTDAGGAARVAERLRAAVEALGLAHAASSAGTVVTVSLGTATVLPTADGSPDALVALADQALYQAKQQGRNRVVVAVAGPG